MFLSATVGVGGGTQAPTPQHRHNVRLNVNTERKSLTKEQGLREAVLLAFCDPMPSACVRLSNLSAREWKKLLYWLDISGLALYFLDRMTELQLCDVLPRPVLARLRQNLADNSERTKNMIREAIDIQGEFQGAGVTYAILKGISLAPLSVPNLALRSQLDLDYLVAEKSLPGAQRILERRGYRLHAVSGRTWEFKTEQMPSGSLSDLYRNVPWRCVELHVEEEIDGRRSLLASARKRGFQGVCMPMLSPADLFVGQGLHVYKHVSSGFLRAAHLLEFRRHVIARRGDDRFWNEVRATARENSRGPLGLGVVTLLISTVMGEFAPETLTSWTSDRLPSGVRLWVEMYGRQCVFANFPGNKLYLLLQSELQREGVAAKRSLRDALVPRKLPPPMALASADETRTARMRRYQAQLEFIFRRLRFHVLEGLRYSRERIRWEQSLSRLAGRHSPALDSSLSSVDLP